ncbi:hypothetical protein [Brevibacillus sp. HB2.2]|uniref:hypothetical protein n=1 Tax=Brevibacillus sp. HB2.2 TaxID=2738846 RepID=UPI00156AD069|nr:hypothetical protein [Brevibacillus sp. HB2.2]NRS50825.1 hypothetical protein [Brevibacillus sp. HB2.2]
MNSQMLSSQTIELERDQVSILGPKLELHNCTVISETDGRGMVYAGLRMHGGIFDQKQALRDFHFQGVHFLRVRFMGKYIGCDFGDWEDMDRSSVSECDFSSARLQDCRLLNCDMKGILIPKWPCFCLLNPAEARDFVISQQWPKKIGLTLDIYTDSDRECVAIIGDASVLAKESGLSLSEIRALLQIIPGVNIVD